MPRPILTPQHSQVNAALRRYAERAAIRSSPESLYLCSRPLSGCEFVSYAPSVTPIIFSAIFNPMGPTLAAVFLADVPKMEVLLLAHAYVNPFGWDSIVHGVIPAGAGDEPRLLASMIERLFQLNGSDEHPLWTALPEYIIQYIEPPNESELPHPEPFMKRCMYEATRFLQPEDLDQVGHAIREARGNPWSRTPVSAVFGGPTGSSTLELAAGWQPSPDSFDRWWEVVTDVEQLEADLPHIQVAWNGSIDFQKDAGNTQMAAAAMSWEEAVAFMNRILMGKDANAV